MKQCSICNKYHTIQRLCNFQDLAILITQLREANMAVPALQALNKEAFATAHYYQGILRKADEAHTILMETLDKYEEGAEIKTAYLEKLDAWAKQHLDPVTAEVQGEQLELLTPQGTATNDSTKPNPGNGSPLIIL